MSRSSFAPRRAALWLAALAVVGACTAGVDRMVGPGSVREGPALLTATDAIPPGIVISQVYGGGGNSGSLYKNDFVELYNGSATDISLEGWSVQYASAGGTSWAVTPLHGTIASGHYYLVQESQGTGGSTPLPTPDAIGTITMGASAGKVALVSSTTALTGSTGCPQSAFPSIVDYVGFGTGTSGANCYEGSTTGATQAPTLSNSSAALRKKGGQQDTDNNGADFTKIDPPTPRNTSSSPLPPDATLTVSVAPNALTTLVAGTIGYTASAVKSGAEVAITSATWSSSNTAVATIDPTTGIATPVGTGVTTISVDVVTAEGNATGSTTLTVTADPATVTVTPATWSLKSGQTKVFAASAKDADGNVTPTTFTWTSSNPAVATIDAASGLATGKAAGSAIVTATTPNGITGTATVTVTAGNVGVQSRTDPLPVGFQTQLFLNSGSTDQAGNPVGGGDVTWSSSDPAIVTVNPTTGIVTAKAAGSAIVTATAKSDGISSGSTTITTIVAPVSPSARVGHNTELGTPTDADPSDDIIIARRQYTLSYNASRGGPNWVSWNLDASHQGTAVRCNCFTADTALTRLGLPAWDTNDWINGGVWSRGHMAPSADWQAAEGDNAPTFFLSNMLPQNQTMNAGAWGNLENRLRALAVGSTEVYIVAGGIFTKDRSGPGVDGFGFMNSSGRIAVPDSVWKVAIVVPDARSASQITSASDVQVIAVRMPNDATAGGTYDRYVTTIDAIQHSTGYDLLSALPESIQCRIESRNCAPIARISGSGVSGGEEGETLTFSAATSSDPDGDALGYRWDVDGSLAGTGSTLGYTFADDGSYSVRLIVTDGNGAADTARTTVTVRNVAPSVGAIDGATILSGETYATTGAFGDPGADSWHATVDYGDGSGPVALPLSGMGFQLEHQYAVAGSYTVTVRVTDDDGGLGASSARVVVQAPLQGVANLSEMLGSLGLSNGELSSLRAKLNAASAALRRDDTTPAVNALEAFTNEVGAMVRSGRLSESAAASVLGYARRVIASASA